MNSNFRKIIIQHDQSLLGYLQGMLQNEAKHI